MVGQAVKISVYPFDQQVLASLVMAQLHPRQVFKKSSSLTCTIRPFQLKIKIIPITIIISNSNSSKLTFPKTKNKKMVKSNSNSNNLKMVLEHQKALKS